MSQWAEIPDHLLELIAEKGTGFEDIVTLGLICKPWRAVAVVCKETFMKKQTQQLPWLMLPHGKGSLLRGFYSFTRKRIHQIPSSESIEKKCYSSRGWLLTVGPKWDVGLLHPISPARFKLPAITPYIDPCFRVIHRVVLSASPFLTSNFVLVVIQGCPPMPIYWRPGDKRWSLIETTEVAFADAVFYQNKCYFITFLGKLMVTDFGICNPTTAKFMTQFSEDLIQGNFLKVLYLVIMEGSLLLVLRERLPHSSLEKKFHDMPYQTINFQVFKFDFKSLGWEELKRLGNWSLFLGHNSSMALNASVVKGCKPNSIYFTDDNLIFSQCTGIEAGFDIGIFNMTDRTIEPLIEGSWRSYVSPPIFVDPTF